MYDAITPINASGITSTSLTTTTIHIWCCRRACKGTYYSLKLKIIILISLQPENGTFEWILLILSAWSRCNLRINAWSLTYPCNVWPSRDIKDTDQCLIPSFTTQQFWLLIIKTIILLNQIIKNWKIKGCKNMKAKAWGELSVPF